MAVTISQIQALEILDSRADPTVEATVTLSDDTQATASVPSGASTGTHEAFELRDNDITRYKGKGVLAAVSNVNHSIRDALVGQEPFDQRLIDQQLIRLDGTPSKQRLGANAILGVSMAIARAAAASQKVPLYRYLRSLTGAERSDFTLPVPLMNVINGGKHASSNLDIQEFWIIPHRAQTFHERLQQGTEVFKALGAILKSQHMSTDLGNEGGYAPNLASHTHALDLLMEAISKAGFEPGVDISLGMDIAASTLFHAKNKKYVLKLEGKSFKADDFIQFILDITERYPIRALEDVLAEEEWAAWQDVTARMTEFNPSVYLIGDDLFVTNLERLKRGITSRIANSILIKPNQIGTVIETLDCMTLAHAHGYSTAVSHRSGETNDAFIADLAVALNSQFIKAGATSQGERMAKYNRLLEIEQELYGKGV